METLGDKRLLSIQSASIYLDTTQGSVRKMIQRGALPSHCVVKIGGRIFLHRKRLDQFLDNQGKGKKGRSPRFYFWR